MKENVKHIATLVTAFAGLAAGVGSCMESAEQSELQATQKIYGVVVEKLEEHDELIESLHRDDVELRAYIEGYREAVAQLQERQLKAETEPRPRPRRRAPAPDEEPMPTAIQIMPPPPEPKAAPRVEQLPDFGDIMKAKQ